MKYPIFDKLGSTTIRLSSGDLKKCLYRKIETTMLQLSMNQQKFIFTSNLKYQTMLDSVQGRGPCLGLFTFCN